MPESAQATPARGRASPAPSSDGDSSSVATEGGISSSQDRRSEVFHRLAEECRQIDATGDERAKAIERLLQRELEAAGELEYEYGRGERVRHAR